MVERIKMLLDIGRLLGHEKMCSLVTSEDAWNIYTFLRKMDVDTNVTSQGYCGDETAIQAYNLKVELVGFGWKTVNTLKEHCWNLWYTTKVDVIKE